MVCFYKHNLKNKTVKYNYNKVNYSEMREKADNLDWEKFEH
jgi:hypothetical protein